MLRPVARTDGASLITAALVDSVVFARLAFEALDLTVVTGMVAAKVLGGAAWAWLLVRLPTHVGQRRCR